MPGLTHPLIVQIRGREEHVVFFEHSKMRFSPTEGIPPERTQYTLYPVRLPGLKIPVFAELSHVKTVCEVVQFPLEFILYKMNNIDMHVKQSILWHFLATSGEERSYYGNVDCD